MKKTLLALTLLTPILFTGCAGGNDSTDTNESIVTSPASPSNTSIQLLENNSITVFWQDNSDNEDDFIIERSIDNISFTVVSTVTVNSETYTDNSVVAGNTYYYRVMTTNAAGDSSYSDIAKITIPSESTGGEGEGEGEINPPISPSNLIVDSFQANIVSISWNDNSDNEQGFIIQRSKTGSTDSYTQIGNTNENTKYFTDTGLSANTQYFYKVFAFNSAGESSSSNETSVTTEIVSLHYIADYSVAKESVLRSIPEQYITAAKQNLHILYVGTSHSTQTVDGMRGLMQYKAGDDDLFAATFNGTPVDGKLDIHYRGTSGTDLSHDSTDSSGHTGYFTGTVSYLDAASHADVNVVMWSWCSIEGHDAQIYLDNFEELINMYKAGGSKGRTAANEVKFVFMSGYARGNDSDDTNATNSPYTSYSMIRDYAETHGHFMLDYWTQDVYNYETNAYKPSESGNSNAQHKAYFDSHQEGIDWFATRDYNSGLVKWPAHCGGTPQHITSNRRAYGAWWIWARLAGWEN